MAICFTFLIPKCVRERALLSTNEPSVRSVPASWKWGPLDPGRARLSGRAEAELLFFDPTGHGRPRDPKRAGETTQAASFLGGVQNLLAAIVWIGMRSKILATAAPTGMTAILLFSGRGMPITHQCLTSTVGTMKGDRYH